MKKPFFDDMSDLITERMDYRAVHIHGVRADEYEDCQVDDDHPQFFSAYAVHRDGESLCIADASPDNLNQLLGWAVGLANKHVWEAWLFLPGGGSAKLVTTQVCPLDSLPVVVDRPGNYVTRDGRMVQVHEIKPKESATFNVKGCLSHVKRTPKGVKVTWHYNIWHPSGRFQTLRECAADIVAKAEGYGDA